MAPGGPLADRGFLLQVLAQDGEEFKMLVEYVSNTHGATHSSYSLEVLDIFRVSRHGESKRYKPFSKLANRMLLWHGSRTTNFAGILSQVSGKVLSSPEATPTHIFSCLRVCASLHQKPLPLGTCLEKECILRTWFQRVLITAALARLIPQASCFSVKWLWEICEIGRASCRERV